MELIIKEKATFVEEGDLVKYKNQYCLVIYDAHAYEGNCWLVVNMDFRVIDTFTTLDKLNTLVESVVKSNKIKLIVEE